MVRVVISYVVDWLIILGTIAFAGSLSFWAKPAARPFSLSDPSIAFPFQTRTKISTGLLVGLSGLLPVVVCLVLTLFVPTASTPSGAGWKRKIYAANKAILGLGLSVGLALLFTDSLKNLMGKPRPDMLSRCQPIVNRRYLPAGSTIGEGLFTWNICTTKQTTGFPSSDLLDGFRSFPSGHASSTFLPRVLRYPDILNTNIATVSFAGLTYTTLFLASFVFSMTLPFARKVRPFSATASSAAPTAQPKFPQMLAFLIVSIPMWIAIYIASTRWSDFRHHGFDVLFGSFEGIVCALIGWSWYGVYSCRRGGVFQGTDATTESPGFDGGDSDDVECQPMRKEPVVGDF